jgi:bacillithiol biosynthesis deacetylase BshB1
MKLDILAFGVHPDDVELSCSGTLLCENINGRKTGIIDLTKGELGTRGNPDTREQEAAVAATIIGVHIRENLGMPDGFFKNDTENQLKVIVALRKYQPEIILCNAIEDRHPDHGRSAMLIADAAFLSGLQKIVTYKPGMEMNYNNRQAPWRPKYVFNYIQDRYIRPDFVIDISGVFEKKLAAIKAFKTQFFSTESVLNDEPQTYISSPEFLDSIIYRSKMFGRMIGVKYAEGYTSQKMIGIRSFDALIKENT